MAAADIVEVKLEEKMEDKSTLTPPASEEADKFGDSGSELSELDGDLELDDIGEIEPDHYYEGGKIPVFKPTMQQFKSFKKFIDKVDKYGMKSGIIKVIPPQEWRDSLPALDQAVKTIKIRNPISQEFHGSHGTYTQANMEKQRSYNLPQWKALADESNHQPPARRGERRRNQEKASKPAAPRAAKKAPLPTSDGKKRGPGRPRTRPLPGTPNKTKPDDVSENADSPTPDSPAVKAAKVKKEPLSDRESSVSASKGRQPKSVTSRRKHNRGEQVDYVDEEVFQDFDYRIHNQDEWTTERCQELETSYWKSLTFNNPMYGADMPGSLFNESTTSWNVAKLENLLDVLGQKVPGVNTAYLYLGMWKATFAWHLEDVDLYSINYIHFGAPKQWYSISQGDARRFENAMRNVWPTDAKNCDQFLRHKTYLISPQILKSQYNIEVNRLVHNEGEFVITFPYGYHSGYNLGYNCAESVNFATEAWLDYGKVARKCNCEADSVWVDVWDIERKLRGEPTPEYYEETEEEEDDEEEEEIADLPTPPGSEKGKPRGRPLKRKRDTDDKDGSKKVKKIRIKIKVATTEEVPCILCPNNPPLTELLPTDTGKRAHRICAELTPETVIYEVNGVDMVHGIDRIDKARLELKCYHCRSKHGSAIQCDARKCIRAYHPTCTGPAGVQVDTGPIPVFDVDGTEYVGVGNDFRCRFHRIRRPKFGERQDYVQKLEDSSLIRRHTMKLVKGDVVQYQYFSSNGNANGDISAGIVLENRHSERTLLISSLPSGTEIEVQHEWILVFDKSLSQLLSPSEDAKPLPAHFNRIQMATEHPTNEVPKKDELFCSPNLTHVWAEFNTARVRNPDQRKVDLNKPNTMWHYIGKISTEARAHYSSDPNSDVHDPASNYLDTIKPPAPLLPAPPVPAPIPRRSYPITTYPVGINMNAVNAARANQHAQIVNPAIQGRPPLGALQTGPVRIKQEEKPYNGKYAIKDHWPLNGGHVDSQAFRNQQAFLNNAAVQTPSLQNTHTARHPTEAHHQGHSIEKKRIPTLAEVRRRTSHSTHNLERWYQQNQELRQQSQAPVANMMAATSPAGQSVFSRPSTSHNTPPSTATSRSDTRPRSDSMKAIEKYPYLLESAAQRPAVYQSPYGPGGIITNDWLPNPKASKVLHSRRQSLAQDFLDKQPPHHLKELRKHVRTISTEKAVFKQQESERMIREHQRRRSNNMPPPKFSPTLTQNTPFHIEHYPPRAFSGSPSFSDFGSYSSQQAFSSMLTSDPHAYSSPSYQPPGPGLQYSTPQDFQLQMQREAEVQATKPLLSHGRNSYDAFVRGLQGGHGIHGHPPGAQELGLVGHDGDGTSGSPLRRGMKSAGAEMLPTMPQMQDPVSRDDRMFSKY